ncbi:MAG: MFS transporter [bacterium]|nr:MFS transporter [bacterium]
MIKKDRNLYIIALIAMVNMLGYGIIIPLLYSYSKRFGLSEFENGLLFAMFSICQFISTPIIGRMSDKYGRKPLLIISLAGTALSFFIMAFAPNASFLYLARALDGLTAGNIPVIFAAISDSTKPQDRAKAFGKIGAAFNFGFVFGPAIAAFTVIYNESLPFIIAGVVTIISVLLTYFYLPETNKNIGQMQSGKLFDIPMLWHTLFDKTIGTAFIISLIYFLAFSCAIIYGFQPFTINILNISPSENAIIFTIFGLVGLITQSYLIQWFSNRYGIKKLFTYGMFLTAIAYIVMGLSPNLAIFIFATVFLAIVNSLIQTLLPTIISQQADEKSQGSVMGLNASYQSIGMIFGPIIGGAIATKSIRLTFIVGSILVLMCFALSLKNYRPNNNTNTTN